MCLVWGGKRLAGLRWKRLSHAEGAGVHLELSSLALFAEDVKKKRNVPLATTATRMIMVVLCVIDDDKVPRESENFCQS